MDIMNMAKRLDALEKRLVVLEDVHGLSGGEPETETLELDLALPEADIDGLHFNKTDVHGVFGKKDDGWYHSRDILFLSARNTEDDNRRDILKEYLEVCGVNAIHSALLKTGFIEAKEYKDTSNIKISLPRGKEGVKKYNGVDSWYWLQGKDEASSSCSYFYSVGGSGYAGNHTASGVGGCAPAFSVETA